MKDTFPFLVFFCLIIMQRVLELIVARNNEKWLKERGAIEFGKEHYRYMVLMHVVFFISLFCEKLFLNRVHTSYWPLLLLVFFIAQAIRIWAISSLGKFWNTKIIVLPNASVVRKGPYRFIKHPNYVVVSVELIVIPMLFGAYLTTCLFTIFNMMILSIRIPFEEKALSSLTHYQGVFQSCNRFLPKL